MTAPIEISFEAEADGVLAAAPGTAVVLALGPETLTPAAAAANEAMGGGLARAIAAAEWKGKPGDLIRFPAPAGLAADALLLVSLGAEPAAEDAEPGGAPGSEPAGATPATPESDGVEVADVGDDAVPSVEESDDQAAGSDAESDQGGRK